MTAFFGLMSSGKSTTLRISSGYELLLRFFSEAGTRLLPTSTIRRGSTQTLISLFLNPSMVRRRLSASPLSVRYEGTSASNSVSAAIGTISQTNITVTAAANTKTYDGTTSAAATPTITAGNLQTGDTASFTESYATSSVGTGKTLTPAGSVSDGNSGANYNYTFVASSNGVINAATLTAG